MPASERGASVWASLQPYGLLGKLIKREISDGVDRHFKKLLMPLRLSRI